MTYISGAEPRISAKRGRVVDLNVDFYRNGVLADPYAIRRIEIYKTSVLPHNLVATVPIVAIDDEDYPSPVVQETTTTEAGDCGTEAEEGVPVVGKYHLGLTIPEDFGVPDVYYDVWYFFADDPCSDGTADCDIDEEEFEAQLQSCCHRFWVYPDGFICDDRLQTINFGFEPINQRFHYPEVRPLEVGVMPLPLYDYNFNLVNPILPMLVPTITITTQHNELLVSNAECRIGLRQGSYRSNPYVIQYDLDTSDFLKGTYYYQLKIALPNGQTRVSQKFIFTIY